MKIGVLASHAGSTLQAVLDAVNDRRLDARVCIVISNNSGSGALLRATSMGIPTAHISSVTHPDDSARDTSMRDILLDRQVDLVLLAGYMKTIGSATQAAFDGRIINTHPSLLPKFGGAGFRAALLVPSRLDRVAARAQRCFRARQSSVRDRRAAR